MDSITAEASGRLHMSDAGGRWTLLATVLGSGVAQLDAMLVNVALPAIAREFRIGVPGLQLVVLAYSIPLTSLILIAGALGDRLGRRRVFVTGVVWFCAASLLSAVAWSLPALLCARALQGIGAALLTPGSLAILQASFDPADRSRAIGAWAALGAIAAALGPLLGGYLIGAVSWRAIFLLSVLLGGIVVWAALRHVPETRDRKNVGPLDLAGTALVAAGLAGTTYALLELPARGPGFVPALYSGALGLAALAGFLLVERRAVSPILPLEVFASRAFTAVNLVCFAVYAGLGGVFFLLMVYLQVALDYTPLGAGAAFLPVTLLMLALSTHAGGLAARIGPRIPLTVGPLVIAAGVLLLARVRPGDTFVFAVLPAMTIFGLGLALTVAPVTATALAALDESRAGVASGVNNAVSRWAAMLAIALLPAISGLSGRGIAGDPELPEKFADAMRMVAALMALGGLTALALVRRGDLAAPALQAAPEPRHAGEWALCNCALDSAPIRPGPPD